MNNLFLVRTNLEIGCKALQVWGCSRILWVPLPDFDLLDSPG